MAFNIFSCHKCDLVPSPVIEPRLPALGAESLIRWTTREIPAVNSSQESILLFFFGQDLNSLTRDQTCVPYTERVES